jgi:hypothetical protein
MVNKLFRPRRDDNRNNHSAETEVRLAFMTWPSLGARRGQDLTNLKSLGPHCCDWRARGSWSAAATPHWKANAGTAHYVAPAIKQNRRQGLFAHGDGCAGNCRLLRVRDSIVSRFGNARRRRCRPNSVMVNPSGFSSTKPNITKRLKTVGSGSKSSPCNRWSNWLISRRLSGARRPRFMMVPLQPIDCIGGSAPRTLFGSMLT